MHFETSVHIRRSSEDVFAYLSDPTNFPDWNSAVQTVRPTLGSPQEAGAMYSMERELPGGRARNNLEIVAVQRPSEFVVRTVSGPTPFTYRYHFSSDNGGTVLHLDADVELEGIPSLAAPLARRAVKRGVDDNLATLKRVLEAGE